MRNPFDMLSETFSEMRIPNKNPISPPAKRRTMKTLDSVVSAIQGGLLPRSQRFNRFLDVDTRLDVFPSFDSGEDDEPVEFTPESVKAALAVSINLGVARITAEDWLYIGDCVRDVACLTYAYGWFHPVEYKWRKYGFFQYFAAVALNILGDDLSSVYPDHEQFNLESLGVSLPRDTERTIHNKYGSSVVMT